MKSILTFSLLLMAGSSPITGAEWLPVCSKCLNPRVTTKTGAGSAKAAAEARVMPEDAAAWCAANMPHYPGCVNYEVQQGGDGARASYKATANCSTGEMNAIDGYPYQYAGVWAQGAGQGRPMLRAQGPGGNIPQWESIRSGTGKARAEWDRFGGYSLSGQWEVLCGKAAPQVSSSQAPPAAVKPPAGALLAQVKNPGGAAAAAPLPAPSSATSPVPSAPPGVSACTGKRYCDEAGSFAAIITDFRASSAGSARIVSATMRFLNKTGRPLILGYVRNSGVAIDEQGNRYEAGAPENVRGMGEIVNGGEFDPKFTIAPGQTSDARVEFGWRWNGRDIIGQRAWDIDFTVREVNEVAPRQYRFGQEHALHFKAVPVRNTMNEAAPAAPAEGQRPADVPQPVTPTSQNQPPAQQPDACGGKPRCYDAGPFVAEIAQAIVIREGATHQSRTARLNIRFRNKTNAPLTLGYVGGSSVLIDNFGMRFNPGSGHDTSATGIGVVEANKADAQFVLGPGESRAATFAVYRQYIPKTELNATGFTYNVTIAQLEVLYNGQQVRTVREHTVTFPDFNADGPTGGATGPVPGGKAAPQNIKQAGDALREIFKKK